MNTYYDYRDRHWFRGIRFVGWVILGALAIAGFAFLFGYFVMLLWNWLMPELFGLATITFWKAAGIILLARLIFGGFKHSHSWNHHDRSHRYYKYRCGRKGKSYTDWRYFDDFWQAEGEKAYNTYVEKQKEQPQQ